MLAAGICLQSAAFGQSDKTRIFVVSSYHREYLWSQTTQQGLCAAMLHFGYLDTQEQADAFTRDDHVESSKAVIQKAWMDTKRKTSHFEIAKSTDRISRAIRVFEPDVILLGDDNGANYIGNQFLDTETPAVFWGINGSPLKYGLLESVGNPGHNITGVWQSGYLQESLDLLKRLVPDAGTFAIVSCDSETSRPKVKQLQAMDRKGKLPLKLVDVVVTNSYAEFRRRTLEVAQTVDAFFVLNHDTLRDEAGDHVDMMTVGKWYLEHISKPEASHEDQFVKEGMLCTANDSGYNQGYEAFVMADLILRSGLEPAHLSPRTPARGPLMVNRQRADMLGISLADASDIVEEVIEKALALE